MAFPTTGVLDNCNRGDASPPGTTSSGVAWSANVFSQVAVASQLRIVSNTLGTNANYSNGYITTEYGADVENYITCSTLWGAGSGSYVFLPVRIQSPETTTWACYALIVVEGSPDTWQIRRYANGSNQGAIGADASQDIAAGDAVGFEVVGSTLTAYRKPSGGSWTQIMQRTDGNLTGAGYIGLELGDTSSRWDDFGGGTYAGAVTRSAAVAGAGGVVATRTASFGRSVAIAATGAIASTAAGSGGAPPVRVVRELPPLRLSYDVETPSGRVYRWGDDEPRPENAPAGVRFSSVAPGGYETFDATLPRRPGVDYRDLERLSTVTARGAGGAVAWQGRLERAPRVSGDQMAVTPSAVGWQAHLDDDKSATFLGLDCDLAGWQVTAATRQASLLDSGGFASVAGPETVPDETGGPVLRIALHDAWAAKTIAEAQYDAGPGDRIGAIRYAWTRGTKISAADPHWTWLAYLSPDDVVSTADVTSSLRAAGPGSGTLNASGGNRRYAGVYLYYDVAGGTAGDQYTIDWKPVVVGTHGLTVRTDTDGNAGLYASDAVAAIVARFAPLLRYTTGADGTVSPSAFVVNQVRYRDPGGAGAMVSDLSKFGLEDWFVWDARTFYWHSRGARGRAWRARAGPTELQETGPAVDRSWESVVVVYQDVDGSMRTAGPPGSGADTEDAALKDSDPDNPANRRGIVRREALQVGVQSASGAVELGRRFLEEAARLDQSGQARIVGHVVNDRGVTHPYWRVRAGDTISFVDAHDTSPRRIVKAAHDVATPACTIDLDAPPDGLSALLARLGATLVPYGL